jgi:hypothetical protein
LPQGKAIGEFGGLTAGLANVGGISFLASFSQKWGSETPDLLKKP